jgi:transcriptional regulatory protein LevR
MQNLKNTFEKYEHLYCIGIHLSEYAYIIGVLLLEIW